MQVFIVGSPLETARALSKRHLNNQINEASIILAALNGAKAWSNHPCVLQYRGREEWLRAYKGVWSGMFVVMRTRRYGRVIWRIIGDRCFMRRSILTI